MSKNVKEKLLKELVENQINYEIDGEGEKEIIILDKDSVDKSFAIPQLKALILDCLENSREYGVKLMLLATSNSVRLRRLNAKNELVDSSKSPKNLSKDRSFKYLSSDSEELDRANRYEELLKKFDIDYERVDNTFLLNEKIVDEVPRLEGVEIIPNSEESSIYITKETILNDQKKFNEIEKRIKEKYNMGKDNEVLFENIESFYLSGYESYLKEVIDIATRNDLFVEISSDGKSLNINHEGSTLLNLVLDRELSQEVKNKIEKATSLLAKENSRTLGELTQKGFTVVNDTPFEYMRKILSNRKVTFYTKRDDKYFIETEEGLIERNEQSLHEDIANCKLDVLIFKDGFRETKGKEDSVSLGDSRFIELLKAINEPKNLNTILNLGEQLEFTIARFDGVVDFSSYSEVILSFCIGDRGFECNTTINKNNPRVQAIIDMIEENPNWDEIFRLCHVNHFNIAQVHDDVIIQDKEGNTILKFKDSKIKETPKQLAEPSEVEETIRTKHCTITTVESLQDCLDNLVNKDVDISLTYSIYCHLQNLINARGKLEVSYEDVSNLSDGQALKYWDKWKKDNTRKTHNEVIPIFEDLATEAVQLNIFINSLFWEALAFENTPNQEVESEVEQAIETAIKEVSEKFNVTLGRFIEFQYETGRNVAKKKVKELQNKIEVEKDLEKKEELTQKLNNEYSVLEQAEVSIEEVDNAEACNISYFIETKVYRIIGKYKYLKWKDYIEYRARQGAKSIVLDKKNVIDDMTKYLTISNRAMRPLRTVTFVYNKEAMKNFSKEEKLDLLNRILSKPTIPYFASELLPKNKVIERICIGTRTGKVQSLPFDIYLYCEGKDLMLNYLDENLNLSGINYEAFDSILKEDLTVACLDERAYDKVRGYCDRKKLDSSRVFNLSKYMTKVYRGFRIDEKFAVIVNDKEREFYSLNKLPGVTTKIQ